MSPKKAIVIVLVLFLVVIMVFAFLYLKKQLASPENALINTGVTGQNGQEKATTTQQKIEAIKDSTSQQVEKIVEQGKTASGGVTKDAAIKLEDTINQALIEGAKLKTPEQLKADQQKQADRAKLEQTINQQMKAQPNK